MSYRIISSDSDLLKKYGKERLVVLQLFFSRKTAENENLLRKSNNLSRSIVGIVANQLYSDEMCQVMSTEFKKRWDYNEETQKFKSRQNRVRTVEKMVFTCFQATRPKFEIEIYYSTGTQKKINSISVHGYCNRFKTLLEQWDIILFSVLVKKLDISLLITISNEEPRKEVWTRFEKTTFEKKYSSKKKHGSLVGGMNLKTM